MSENNIISDQIFSNSQRQVISAIANAMIGPDDALKLPSASDPEVMVTILEKATHFAARLQEGIDALCTEIDPLTVPVEQLTDLLDKDPRFRSFGRILTIVVMQSYYQNPRVLAAHGLAARPPFPLGHEVDSGDWSLLDPVKNRGPIYRPV